MHKLHNTPFAIVIVRDDEPVGMYRGNTRVVDDEIWFASLDTKLDRSLPDEWLRTIRSVRPDIADDLGYADYFITVDSDEFTEE